MWSIGLLLFLLTLFSLALLTRYIMLKKQIRNLTKQMNDLAGGINEKMVDISFIDRDLEQLAVEVNRYNQIQRYSVACVKQHEEHLKESVANISHDLRTPLTVILGHLQLLLKQFLTEEQTRRVEIILNKAEKMKELVAAFYELSVLEAEQVKPQKEKINLTNLLTDMITENAPLMESRQIHPEIILPDHSIILFSDSRMIERIFQNLLTNAIRYSNGNLKISLFQPEKESVVFSIENTVGNMEEVDVERMFERFYTGDKARHYESTGLGLAVVKLLTEKLDGRITASVRCDVLSVNIIFKIKNPPR